MIDFLRKTLGLSGSIAIDMAELGGRGSGRVFYRCTWGRSGSAILIHYGMERPENGCYADICGFLKSISIPVPRVYGHDRARCLLAMEDLGDRDLWQFRTTAWEVRKGLYEKTLTVISRLHAFPEKDFPRGSVSLMEDFSPALYRWERDYFRERFVHGYCGINLEGKFAAELDEELGALSEGLLETGRCLIHRDFQSQNVMIRGEEPVLIDFQGMRFGSLFYDLGSLLCDPYVKFSDEERKELISFSYDLSGKGYGREQYENLFWEASAQRLIQALGAYGFLGITRGLTVFLDHIPSGLMNLKRAITGTKTLARLGELVERCSRSVDIILKKKTIQA